MGVQELGAADLASAHFHGQRVPLPPPRPQEVRRRNDFPIPLSAICSATLDFIDRRHDRACGGTTRMTRHVADR